MIKHFLAKPFFSKKTSKFEFSKKISSFLLRYSYYPTLKHPTQISIFYLIDAIIQTYRFTIWYIVNFLWIFQMWKIQLEKVIFKDFSLNPLPFLIVLWRLPATNISLMKNHTQSITMTCTYCVLYLYRLRKNEINGIWKSEIFFIFSYYLS